MSKKKLADGRKLFNVKTTKELLTIAGAYYGELDSQEWGTTRVGGESFTTKARNLVRKGFKKAYKIDNLRPLNDGEGPHIPYGNYAGPKTNLDEAEKYGVVNSGPMAVENSEGLSGDEISRQHDYMYLNAESLSSDKEKFDAIQYADKWMLDQVSKLPESVSKTKKLLYASIKAKYETEKKLGRLLYGGTVSKVGGKLKFEPKPIKLKKKGGSGYVSMNKKEHLKKRIEAEINDYLEPEKKQAVEMKTEFESVESRIKKNLEKVKKQDDLEKASLLEDNKPLSKKDGVGRALTQLGFRKSTNFDEFENYEPYADGEVKQRWEYNIGFKTNDSISENQRPKTGTYVWVDGVECPVTGSVYNYGLPVYLNNEGVYKIDNMDITISRFGDTFKSQSGGDLITALQKIKRGFFKFTANELLHLGEWDFISNKKLYYEPSIKLVDIERNSYKGLQEVDESKRIDLSDQLEQNKTVSSIIEEIQDKVEDEAVREDTEDDFVKKTKLDKDGLEAEIAKLKSLLTIYTKDDQRKRIEGLISSYEVALDKATRAYEKKREKQIIVRQNAINRFINSFNNWLDEDTKRTRASVASKIKEIKDRFGQSVDYSLIETKNGKSLKTREEIKKVWNDGENSLIDELKRLV